MNVSRVNFGLFCVDCSTFLNDWDKRATFPFCFFYLWSKSNSFVISFLKVDVILFDLAEQDINAALSYEFTASRNAV